MFPLLPFYSFFDLVRAQTKGHPDKVNHKQKTLTPKVQVQVHNSSTELTDKAQQFLGLDFERRKILNENMQIS